LARISASGGQALGTAFALGGSKVATALHVVNGDDAGLVICAPDQKTLSGYQNTSGRSFKTIRVRMVEADPIRDLCILEMQEAEATVSYSLSGTDAVQTGTSVETFGFPHADAGRTILTYHRARVGARVLIENQDIMSKHLVLNMYARPGQSGAPVLTLDGKVVALLTGSFAPGGGGLVDLYGVDPATLHQTTHAVSAQYLKDML
jgi:S1-C subfamily serine protease